MRARASLQRGTTQQYLPIRQRHSQVMGFKVKDKMLMNKLSDGKKVEFEFMQEDKDYVITFVK